MTTIKVKLRVSSIAGRAGSVYYQVTHRRAVRKIHTRIHLLPSQWDAQTQRVVCEGAEAAAFALQQHIDHDVAVLRRIDDELIRGGMPYTVADVVERFEHDRCTVTLCGLFRLEIETFVRDRRFGTARNYERALRSLNLFLGGTDLPIDRVGAAFVRRYNSFLVDRGLVRNSISFYMRILRAVYRKALKEGHIATPPPVCPFADVYTGIDKTVKRAVGEDTIRRLSSLDLSREPALAFARDLFLFSYCARGMAFVDVAFLRRGNLSGNMLHYNRHKTHQLLSVRMEPFMCRIVERYASEAVGDYLFPILKTGDSASAYRQYQTALRYYNSRLRRLSGYLGIETLITSYTSRHSWATSARNHRIPMPVISAGLGHTSERTTRIYIASLEHQELDEANSTIVNALMLDNAAG